MLYSNIISQKGMIMNRREALKAVAITTLASTSLMAYDAKKVVNHTKMKTADPKHPTKAELKHTPDITIKDVDAKGYTLVEVEVGQEGIIHPSTEDHWIYEVALYADDTLIDTVALEPVLSRGYLASRVNLKGVKTLTAVAKCNLHGDWQASVNVG